MQSAPNRSLSHFFPVPMAGNETKQGFEDPSLLSAIAGVMIDLFDREIENDMQSLVPVPGPWSLVTAARGRSVSHLGCGVT